MKEITKLSLIKEFADQIKKLPESVSASFNGYLQGKYDLDDLREKADHADVQLPLGSADIHERRQLAF